MFIIRQVTAGSPQLVIALAGLLEDAVASGASVGFLASLDRAEAVAYWEGVLATLGSERVLWVAEVDDVVVGTVQLVLCERVNGRHRAEVQKLLVDRAYRGGGVASRLMAAVEVFARAHDRTLLVLDTQAGSHAEAVYRHLQWQRVGEVPMYAASPDGELQATVYYFKQLVP